MNILYIGPWASDKALFSKNGPIPAATAWARGLLHALAARGHKIHVCTHCREQAWPFGALCPGDREYLANDYPVRFVRYVNLPWVRERWLDVAYPRMILKEIRKSKPDIVIMYNLESCHCSVVAVLKKYSVNWIPIILDQNDVERSGWKNFTRKVKGAVGLVFLSYWGYKNCPTSIPRLHLDGGVKVVSSPCFPRSESQKRGETNANKNERLKTVVYSGLYDEGYGGLDKLYAMFAEVQNQKCQFVLTGKDTKGILKKYLMREPRVKYVGFVSWDELEQIYKQASVFVNPRDSNSIGGRMTFPSKLMEYLSWGKPVVSTWTDGLAPDYRKILLTTSTENNDFDEKIFGALIDRALNMSEENLKSMNIKIEEWAAKHTWDVQAERLDVFIRDLIFPAPATDQVEH